MSEEMIKKTTLIWSCQRALLTAVTPTMRQVYVGRNAKQIMLFFIFDGEVSDEDWDEASCVDCEVGADFPDDYSCEFQCIRIDSPKPVPFFGEMCVYARKEKGVKFDLPQTSLTEYLGSDYQKIDREWLKRRLAVLASCQRALLGNVTSHLRHVSVQWTEDKIWLKFRFDGTVLSSDKMDAEVVLKYIEEDFEGKSVVEGECIQWDFPRLLHFDDQEYTVYSRKEVYPKE